MKAFVLVVIVVLAFASGIWIAPKLPAAWDLSSLQLPSVVKRVDYWTNRYQTFLGVMVAIAVAYLTVSAMSKQNAISERQFLSGQIQGLLGDQATLQFVSSQLNEAKAQKVLFENNIAFLETEGDKTTGWLNANNYIRTAYSNVENFRSLVSANTAKFLGDLASRSTLIASLDSISESQEALRKSFLAWADLNRTANADPNNQPPPEKLAYMRERDRILARWAELLQSTAPVADELRRKIDQIDKDIANLRAAIREKLDS